jgi:hypothetical protein
MTPKSQAPRRTTEAGGVIFGRYVHSQHAHVDNTTPSYLWSYDEGVLLVRIFEVSGE